MKEEILSLESDFSNNEYFGTNVWTEEKYRVLSGGIPVIFSSPHSVNQIRGEDVRDAEKFTGALTRYISTLTNSYAIYQMFTHADPNNDEEHNYKNALLNLIEVYKIKLLIDIHSSDFKDDCDIDIVTNNHETLCGHVRLIEILKLLAIKNGLKIDEHNIPNKEKENEIISTTSLVGGIPSIRLVINKNSLDIYNNEITVKKICNFLNDFVSSVKNI